MQLLSRSIRFPSIALLACASLVSLADTARGQILLYESFDYGVTPPKGLLHGMNGGYGWASPWVGNNQAIGNWGSYWVMDGSAADFGGPVGANGVLSGGRFVFDVPSGLSAVATRSLVLDNLGQEHASLDGHVGKYADMMRGTIMGWVKTTNLARQTIVSMGDPTQTDRYLSFGTQLGLVFFEMKGDLYSPQPLVQSVASVADGQWHHIAVVVDGAGYAQIYIDAAASGPRIRQGFFGHLLNPTTMSLGRQVSSIGPGDYYDGQLAGVSVYGSPLRRVDLQRVRNGASHPLPGLGPAVQPGPDTQAGSLGGTTFGTFGLSAEGDRYADQGGERVHRKLAVPFDATQNVDYYMSFLIRRDDGGGPVTPCEILITDGVEHTLVFDWDDQGRFRAGTKEVQRGEKTMADATTYFVVMEIKLTTSIPDRVHLKVYEPGERIHESAAEIGTRVGAGYNQWLVRKWDQRHVTADQLWIIHDTRGAPGVGTLEIDEIRIGKTWDDVTKLGFGTPCLGATLSKVGRPSLGSSFSLNVNGVRAQNPAFLMIGSSRGAWGATVLPLDLTSLGAPGCWLNVAAEFILPTVTNGVGFGSVQIGIPNRAAMVGNQVWAQWTGLDVRNPPRNPGLPLAFSQGYAITVER